jgi:predicted MPP superfamily phosphohydrolase
MLLGVMQVVVGHWVLVVFAGHAMPPLPVALGLAALLVTANVVAIPFVRRAARRGGVVRRMARAYISIGLSTLIVGCAIGASWAGFLPLATLLGAAGIGADSALTLFRIATVPVVAVLGFMVIWGFTGGQVRIDRTVQRIPLVDLPESLRGLRIVQISDLHIGNAMEGHHVAALARDVNALSPDLIAITGDIFDFDPEVVPDGCRELAALHARLGVYVVLGNHDWYTGYDTIAANLATHAPHMRLLRGEVLRVPTDAPLYVAGIDDPGRDWTAQGIDLPELEELGRRKPADGPTILLVHRPEVFPQAARLGFPLVLAGHTHGGQIALPTLGGHFNPARLITRFYRGLYMEHRSVLYVNRGIGVAGPRIRFNCPREIATIELV